MNRAVLGLLLSLVACSSERSWPGGTGVGNPGTTRLTMERVSWLTIDRAEVGLASWKVERCDGTVVTTPVDRAANLLDPEPDEVPGGAWCELTAIFEAPLVLEGRAENGEPGKATVELTLEVEEAPVVIDTLAVDGGSWVVELRPPSKDDLGGLEDGSDLVVVPGDPDHDALAAEVSGSAALWEDVDEDGVIGDDERNAGPVAGDDHSTTDD